MSGDKRARLKQWLESGRTRLEPLTFPQRELWEASPVPAADVANHICCLIEFRGVLTARECEAALQRVVDRQEVLRLSFLPGRDRPVQMIRESSQPNFQFRELAPAQRGTDAIEELAREIFVQPFDLVQGPLYRAQVLRRAADEHVMVLAIHHAIADGWTLGVFVQDLCAAYLHGAAGAPGGLAPVPLSYTAWGAAERAFWQAAELDRRAAFWKSHLAGTRRIWNGHSDAPVRPQRWVSAIPSELGRASRELARRTGATLFSTLLAAFQLALSKWTGADDIVVGTPVANRAKQAVHETMGYCSGIVPLRGHIDRERPFHDALRSVHRTTVDCFANAMPFAELARALGDAPAPGRNPIFEVRFALQNHPIPDVNVPGFSARLEMRSTGTARFDLGCEITEKGDALEVVWLFRPNLFSQQDIEELDRIFGAVLAGVCRSPENRAAALVN
ncbi:MAG TPA: condensation domain-containing protein [Chthoniobacteraceae bacterium]|nr:condensation domain-containing protein [Chthoniobacteraceae bacterium]